MITISDVQCTVDECTVQLKTNARYWCSTHWGVYAKYGTPTPQMTCENCSTEYLFKGRKLGYSNRFCPKCFQIYKDFGYIDGNGNRIDPFKRHKITVFTYYQLLVKQGFSCRLCHFETKRLQVDHDRGCCDGSENRSCGKCIRGLLCHNCNGMIGHYEKNKGKLVIDKLDEYIMEYKIRKVTENGNQGRM